MGGDAFARSREKRRGVTAACADLEQALARPAAQDPRRWSEEAVLRLRELADAFSRHAEQSEGPGGLLTEIIGEAPRLANAVKQIEAEHRQVLSDIDQLKTAASHLEDADAVRSFREHSLLVLRAISAHRQRGAELIYEAYSVDIQGSD